MKTIYISGPMAGLPNFNFAAFDKAEHLLKSLGYQVFSPSVIGRRDMSLSYEYKLRKALILMLECESIYFLKGYEFSLGARLEKEIALALKMTILYEE